MSYAYDELYVTLTQRMLGDMYDYAVGSLKLSLSEFQKMFLVSRISENIQIGNPHYVAGKNGCEVAREVIESCTGQVIEAEDQMYLDKSPEYWIGWNLAYYQWLRNITFSEIEEVLPVEEMYGMYMTLHEADISVFIEILDERFQKQKDKSQLKRLRKYAGMSQRILAERSGVPLRQIQLFEQGQRDISKTQASTLKALAVTLKCNMVDLF